MQAMSMHSSKLSFFRLASWLLLCLWAQATTVLGATFDIPIFSLTNHNTSAYSAYNKANFGANFGNITYVDQYSNTMAVDPTLMDQSLNWNTPGHVSKTDVHSLIPSRPGLRWFAHATPWFDANSNSHIKIGLTCNTTTYVQSMINDMKQRGFNGVVIDWYGITSGTDGVVQKIKSYLQSIPGNTFTYIIMIDKGVYGGDTEANLIGQIQYCQTNYFNDPNYEKEPVSTGKPILMFFGVRNDLQAAGMADLKYQTGGNTSVWVEQGTGYLSETWEDESFQWSDQYNLGVDYSDPFNLKGVTNSFATIQSKGKKAFGAMCSRFNGTLTKKLDWSLGKYLPCSNGVCMVQRAKAIDKVIPSNMTRMQWVTWSDWEEGTEVEGGMENYFTVSAQFVSPNTLSWTNTTGDESTVDHYEVYASQDGLNAAFLGTVPTGVYQTNLTPAGLAPGDYKLFVDAIGKPCVRDHLSPAVSATLQTGATITQDPTNQTVLYGSNATFYVSATGTPPLTYTWRDQNWNTVGTNSSLTITNATQNNSYWVMVSNPFNSAPSAVATLTVLTAPVLLSDVQPLSQTLNQGDAVSFAVSASGKPTLQYQWTLNGQNITGATAATYSFAALPGTNYYRVTVSNGSGSTNSSTAMVVGLPLLNPGNYYGTKITFSGFTNGGSVSNFPVLVRLSPSIPGFAYSQFVSPNTGADLRFATASGRLLPFQTNQWNTAGESQVWVQVPSLTGPNDYIRACWGNPADSGPMACNTNGAVWTNLNGTDSCVVAYHFSETGAPYGDSTLQYPGTSGSAPASTGSSMIGRGCTFSGSQFLNVGSGPINLGKTFTLSAWVNITPGVTTEQTVWCNKAGGWQTAGFDFYINSYTAGDGKIYFDSADGTSNSDTGARTAAGAVSFGQWHLVTGAMDGVNGVVRVYVDGVDRTIDTSVNTAFQTTNYVRCGSLLTGTPGTGYQLGFTGSMDEPRLESGVRSPTWVWASWATVANSNFATYGAVAPPVVNLQAQWSGGQVVLSWPLGTLQAAPNVAGPYTNVTGVPNPYPVTPSTPQLFFRVKVQ